MTVVLRNHYCAQHRIIHDGQCPGCSADAPRWRWTVGPPGYPAPDVSPHKPPCRVCHRPVKSRNLCARHLKRYYRYGDPNHYPPRGRPPGAPCHCGGKHYARGLCVKHWTRAWRAGEFLVD